LAEEEGEGEAEAGRAGVASGLSAPGSSTVMEAEKAYAAGAGESREMQRCPSTVSSWGELEASVSTRSPSVGGAWINCTTTDDWTSPSARCLVSKLQQKRPPS
jgi:hypothetical protein